MRQAGQLLRGPRDGGPNGFAAGVRRSRHADVAEPTATGTAQNSSTACCHVMVVLLLLLASLGWEVRTDPLVVRHGQDFESAFLVQDGSPGPFRRCRCVFSSTCAVLTGPLLLMLLLFGAGRCFRVGVLFLATLSATAVVLALRVFGGRRLRTGRVCPSGCKTRRGPAQGFLK